MNTPEFRKFQALLSFETVTEQHQEYRRRLELCITNQTCCDILIFKLRGTMNPLVKDVDAGSVRQRNSWGPADWAQKTGRMPFFVNREWLVYRRPSQLL